MDIEDIKKLSEPLSIDQIDFRVQSINKGGYATILAYKDARVDMQRLDDVVGPLNWKRSHLRENHNCVVSIYNLDIGEWVSKEDTGTESQAEAQKGLASDSFKRACFNWGIGRELYDYPMIQIKLKDEEFTVEGTRAKATWKLKIREWVWYSQFKDGVLVYLAAKDEKGGERFRSGQYAVEFSDEQKAEYIAIMAAEDGWAMKAFAAKVGRPVMEELFNAAPKGEITRQKKLCNKIVTEANGFMKAWVVAIEDMINNGDSADAMTEAWNELNGREAGFCYAAMDEVTLKNFNDMTGITQ